MIRKFPESQTKAKPLQLQSQESDLGVDLSPEKRVCSPFFKKKIMMSKKLWNETECDIRPLSSTCDVFLLLFLFKSCTQSLKWFWASQKWGVELLKKTPKNDISSFRKLLTRDIRSTNHFCSHLPNKLGHKAICISIKPTLKAKWSKTVNKLQQCRQNRPR